MEICEPLVNLSDLHASTVQQIGAKASDYVPVQTTLAYEALQRGRARGKEKAI